MPATRRYEVVLMTYGSHLLARLDELHITTVGGSVDEALANTRYKALRAIGQYESSETIPLPEHKTLRCLELPLPPPLRRRARRIGHLHVIEDEGVVCL
ncbi:MAG: hypothetical protein ACRDLF_09170 [Solirubrobacteraceae bacterium]